MKLIIDIDEQIWGMVVNTGTFGCYRFNTSRAIRNGTPLPKGHGELIDRGALPMVVQSLYDIRLAPTIIEADTESEDKG